MKYITDKTIEELRLCTNLTEMNIQKCADHKDMLRGFFINGYGTKIKHLQLNDAIKFDDISLDLITKKLPKLESANFINYGAKNGRIPTNTGLVNLANNCHNLKTLLLNFDDVDDEGFRLFINQSPQLEKISIYRCRIITNQGLESISQSCPRLKALEISQCNNFEAASLTAIAKIKKLKYFKLLSCETLMNTFDLENFIISCKNLKYLGFYEVKFKEIPNFDINAIYRKFPHLSEATSDQFFKI